MSIVDMIPGVEQVKVALNIAIGAAVLIGGLYIYCEWHDYQEMKQNYSTLQTNNTTLKNNLNTCVIANSTDNKTITDLLNERSDAKTAVNNLAHQQQSNVATIGALKKKLSDMENDAKNDGPLAPDLRETIRGIEGVK